jgi:hypothetical protein
MKSSEGTPKVFAVAAPLALVVELFHPHPHDLLQLDLPRWMFVHYAAVAIPADLCFGQEHVVDCHRTEE